MIDYAEKRHFIRMPVRCAIRVQTPSDSKQDDMAELLDLSATGMHFLSRQAHETGEQLRVTVSPENPITPPLQAEVSVVRCAEIDTGFDIAATIDLIAPALYPGDD